MDRFLFFISPTRFASTISGVVRPQDISGINTVLSTQVMDAEIQLTGRGILADTQRPGIIYRLLDWLRLF